MVTIESVFRLIRTVQAMAMQGIAVSAFGLLSFTLVNKLAPRFGHERPDPQVFKMLFERPIGMVVDWLGPKIGAKTDSQRITESALLSGVGVIVIALMVLLQITSLSAALGGAIAVYSVAGVTLPVESLFWQIVAFTVLLAAAIMVEANEQIQTGTSYA